MTEQQSNIKLKMVGNSGVGKSSIILRYTENKFDESLPPTIGIDYRCKSIVVKSIPVKLSIWDTAGQEKFRTVTSTYYKGAHAIAFVYDVANKKSFEDIIKWAEEADTYVNSKSVVKMIIANKVDLESQRVVSKTESEMFARKFDMLHCECSAKTTVGVDLAFNLVCEKIIEINGITPSTGIEVLNKEKEGSNSSCC